MNEMAATSAHADPTDEEQSSNTGTFRAEPPARQRVADYVFESLARAILKSELKPGEPLATQRELAKQFNVSALVVRQAIHRLEDLGLVRVRQGSTTIVLDPEESTDIRLIQLQLELAEPGKGLATAAFEMQSLFMLPLLTLAERRITAEEIAVLNYLIDNMNEDASPEEAHRFRVQFFRQIAKATRNELYQQQVRWWATMVLELERRGRAARAPMRKLNLTFHRELTRALAERSGAPMRYLELMRPILDWFDAQRGVEPGKGGGTNVR
jgi:DNA-binding FadR family transcriptional regulator